MPNRARSLLERAIKTTRGLGGMRLTLALSYSGRDEIVRTARRLARRVADGELDPDAIDDVLFGDNLDTEAVDARYEDGVLHVTIPVAAEAKPRKVEVGRKAGCGYAQLIQRATDIDWRALDGATSVGITAGASAPEVLVDEVIAAFRDRYDVTERLVETAREDVEFKVPRILRETVA